MKRRGVMKCILIGVTAGCGLAQGLGAREPDSRPVDGRTPVVTGQQEQPGGRELYNKNCRQCHGTTGAPTRTMRAKFERIPDLSDTAFMATLSEDSVLIVIKRGAKDEKDMKGFADKLSPEEMGLVARYVRTLSVKP